MVGMTTDELIKETLERNSKAMTGPWEAYEAGVWTHDEPDCYRVMRGDRFAGEEVAVIREWSHAASLDADLIAAYRTAAPLLARKLQRAMEVLRCIEDETAAAGDAAIYLDEIEAME